MIKSITIMMIYILCVSVSLADSYIEYTIAQRQEINESDCNQAYEKIADLMKSSITEIETYSPGDLNRKKNLQALHDMLNISEKKIESCLLSDRKNEEVITSALSDISMIVINLRGWQDADNYLIPSKERMLREYQRCIIKITNLINVH